MSKEGENMVSGQDKPVYNNLKNGSYRINGGNI
jgi:hypothetical protein